MKGEVAEGLHVIDAADVLGDAEGVEDRAEREPAPIPEARLLDVRGGHLADLGLAHAGPKSFTWETNASLVGTAVRASMNSRIGESFPCTMTWAMARRRATSEPTRMGRWRSREFGEMRVLRGSATISLGALGEGLLEARRGDRVALGHVGADGRR